MKKNEKHPHSGHRRRMTENFMSVRKAPLTEVQFVEMLLFFCITRSDTNPTAHSLLRKFGSIRSILEADEKEIAKTPGMGPASARKLKNIGRIAEGFSAIRSRSNRGNSLTYHSLRKSIIHFFHEEFVRLHTDIAFMLISFDSSGNVVHYMSFNQRITDSIRAYSKDDMRLESDICILCVMNRVLTSSPKLYESFSGISDNMLQSYKIDAVATVNANMKITFRLL